MKLQKKQRGATIWSVSFILLLIGFVAFTVLRLFPVYMEDFAIASSVESVVNDTAAEYRGARSVRQTLFKRLKFNNVKALDNQQVSVIREGDHYNINVDYEVVVPYIGNISLLINFKHSGSVRASV
jgi:hypothetical protein